MDVLYITLIFIMSKKLTYSQRLYRAVFGEEENEEKKEKKEKKPNEPLVRAAQEFRNNASTLAGKKQIQTIESGRESRHSSRKQSGRIDYSNAKSMEDLLREKGYNTGGKKRTLRKKVNKRKTKKNNQK
jgi:hypothetical protein